MSEPKPLNPTEQDALVKQIGLTLMRAAPEDWRAVVAEYRATGRYFELSAELRLADGSAHAWAVPQDVAALFARLRAGMHREGRGSWTNARYQLDHPSSYNLDFDRAEPKWQNPPPQQAYFDEMRFFPRADENVPDWLRRRLSPPTPAFRSARVFDGAGPGGRPSVNRPPVPEPEVAPLLAYLTSAPVAVAGRGFDADVLAADAPQVVPSGFQTDGVWIWPAGISYYLRKYGVPPEPELVERARAAGFALPEVSEETRLAAAANLGAPAAPPGTQLPSPPEPEVVDEPAGEPQAADATQFVPQPVFDDEDDYAYEEPEEITSETVIEEPEPVEPGPTVAVPLPPLAGDGPPYRVVFDSDGLPERSDDRHLRDTYGAGMDLFAPHPTEVLPDPSAVAPVEVAPVQEREPENQQDEPDERPDVPAEPEPELFTHQHEDHHDEFAQEELAEEPFVTANERTDSFVPEADEHPRDVMQDTMAWSPVLDEPEEHPAEVTEEHPVVAVEQDEPDLAEEELETTAAFDPPVAEPSPVAPEPAHVEETTQFDAALFVDEEPEPEPEPEPRQVTPEEDRELAGTRRALDDLNVPHGVYRIGEPADRTWTLHLDGDAWEVCWFDQVAKSPMRFERVEDASAYLVGKLVLGNFRTIVRTPPPPPPAQRPPMGNGFREEPRRPAPPRPQVPQQAAQQAPPPPPPVPAPSVPQPAAPVQQAVAPAADNPKSKWPISPMNGEPPLTLFRHKEMFELPAGTEVDRYGDQSGNLVYVAGTPFPERSLVPSWINRPYRVYRLRRPLEVLTGVAVPWFEQPGGGTAYLLPKAIDEMIADGALVEISADN